MSWHTLGLVLAGGVIAFAGPGRAQAGPGGSADDRLAAARRFVEQSDRYLHHSKLRRGMEGYGLTVLAGTEIVRFRAVVVSVVERWGPHQDVILATLSGQRLEHTGIIAGMSGSPVYFKDPADGKFKLVGAVAYGWRSSKDPLCGIQPVTQMLAAAGWFRDQPGGGPGAAVEKAAGTALPPGQTEALLAAVLDPRKTDFADLRLPGASRRADAEPPEGPAPHLVALATPLMVSGAAPGMLAELSNRLERFGIVPVASGGPNAAEAAAAGKVALEPGAALAVSLVTGDADFSAVGTITDVVDGRVMAFGHSFYGQGELKLPLGPAYVHTCVAGLFGSFKLAAGLDIAGTLQRDEEVAVAGAIGPKPAMVPLTVRLHWAKQNRKETYQFHLAHHREMMPMFARMLVGNSAGGWHAMPEHHVVRHAVSVEYGKLGTYKAANVSCDNDIGPAVSDLLRPVAAMLGNPYGERTAPRKLDVELTIEEGAPSAAMLDLKLAGNVYRPGETLTGELTIRPYRKAKQSLEIRFELPEDLPDGEYSLTVCDAARRVSLEQQDMPHRFAPRSTEDLFEAVQYVVQPSAGQLYLHLPLRDGGLALGMRELPDLPDSRAQVLSQAGLPDTKRFRRSLVRTLPTDLIVQGSQSAGFRVLRQTDETLLRK